MNEKMNILKRYGIQFKLQEPKDFDVPGIYKKKYKFNRVQFYGKVNAVIITRTRDFSIESFVQDSIYLSRKLDSKIILNFSELSEDDSARLNISNIPYFSDHIIFLPFLGMVIEETSKPKLLREIYTVNQQRVLIYILFNKSETIVAKEVHKDLKMPIATVYRVLKYFSDIEYIESIHGEYIYLKDRTTIYKDSLKYFLYPIEKEITVPRNLIKKFEKNNEIIFKSGIDALSEYSMLASMEREYGISEESLLRIIGKMDEVETEEFKYILNVSLHTNVSSFYVQESNDIKLDVWKYNPISYDTEIIDPISLRLIVNNNDNDPRIESAIEELDAFIDNELKYLNEGDKKFVFNTQ